MRKRDLCRSAVFVRPSVTFVHSVETNKHQENDADRNTVSCTNESAEHMRSDCGITTGITAQTRLRMSTKPPADCLHFANYIHVHSYGDMRHSRTQG